MGLTNIERPGVLVCLILFVPYFLIDAITPDAKSSRKDCQVLGGGLTNLGPSINSKLLSEGFHSLDGGNATKKDNFDAT